MLAYILASQKNLDIFWIYLANRHFGKFHVDSPFRKISRGLIFASAMILKKNISCTKCFL